MTKRKIAWIILLLTIATSALGLYLGAQVSHDLNFTEREIQGVINGKLPLTRNDVTVKVCQVNFNDNQLAISTKAEGKKWSQSFTISVKADCTPAYEALSGNFYLKPKTVEVTEFRLNDESVSTKVESLIDRFVDSPKILANKDAIGSKTESWSSQAIENGIAWILNRAPIYTIPSTYRGNIIRMSIDSVEIRENILIVHLSFLQLTKMLLLYGVILILAIAIAIAIFMHPEWGLPLEILAGL